MSLIALRQPLYGRGRRYFEGGAGHLFMYIFGRFQVVRSVMARVHRRNRAEALASSPTLSTQIEKIDVEGAVRQIRNDGFFAGLRLRDELMEQLLTFSSVAPCYGDSNDDFPIRNGDRRDAAQRFKLGTYKHALSACPALQALTSDPQLLAIAGGYLQSEPVLIGARMWWSFAGVSGDPQRQRESGQDFHYDLDGYRAVAFFFYLTDVGDLDGPHVYVQGSHREKPLRYLLSLFKARTDAEIERYYGNQRQITLCGPAGYGFAEDIFGFHRGAAPKEKDRLVLQLRYGLRDYGTAKKD